MRYLGNLARSKGDPKLLRTGRSSLGSVDRLGRALGWFSLGLGGVELMAPRLVTRFLGLRGREALVRGFGAREIGSGLLTLSIDSTFGLVTRVAGDALDIATVAAADRRRNPQRQNARLALLALIGVAIVDVAAAAGVRARHARGRAIRDYSDRSGYPKGIDHARGAAAQKVERQTASFVT